MCINRGDGVAYNVYCATLCLVVCVVYVCVFIILLAYMDCVYCDKVAVIVEYSVNYV